MFRGLWIPAMLSSLGWALSDMAELYVSDAFGTVHRAHASTAGVAAYLPAVAGFLIGKELQFLGNSYNLNLGSAMSLVLMVIVLLCMSFTSSFDESEMEGVM